MHCRFGSKGGIEHNRFRRAGECNDTSPALLAHARHDSMRELTDTEEVEHHAFFPLALFRVERQRTALAGRIYQDIDMAEQPRRLGGHTLRCVLVIEISLQRNDLAPSWADVLDGQLLNELGAPSHADYV